MADNPQVPDAAGERAPAAGADPLAPIAGTITGERYANLRDPFGHIWSGGKG